MAAEASLSPSNPRILVHAGLLFLGLQEVMQAKRFAWGDQVPLVTLLPADSHQIESQVR